MRQDVQGLLLLVPMTAIEVIAILGDAGQVDDTKQGAVTRPIGIIGRRLTQVVETGPHELSHAIGQILMLDEIILRKVRPAAMLHIVARALMIIINRHRFTFDRELIDTTRADRRSRLTTKDQLLRQDIVVAHIAEGTVVESRHVHHRRKAILHHGIRVIHPLCHRTCRILSVANILQPFRHLITLLIALVRHLVTNTPEHDAGIVAVMTNEIHQILLRPIVEKQVIAIGALRGVPLVETLSHQHHTHLIACLHQLGRRHVVRGTYRIATHIFQHLDLMTNGRLIDRRTQRT